MTHTTTWLTVQPLDTMMVRDGRSFTAGLDAAAEAVPPAPSTFGGVVSAAHGQRVTRIVGPVPHRMDTALFPAPLDLVTQGDPAEGRHIMRLQPTERPLPAVETTDLDPAAGVGAGRLSHALYGEGDPLGGWITAQGMRAWLAGDGMPPGAALDRRARRWLVEHLWTVERHTGLTLDPESGTAVNGLFYSAGHLRPIEDLSFVLGCIDPNPVAVDEPVVALGGRGRMAQVLTGRHGDPFPPAPPTFPGGRLLVYLVSPALVSHVAWTPPQTTARLCAVVTTGPQPVASASPTDVSGTRRLLWAVPAGSLFYLQFDTDDDAATWSRRFHGDLLPGVSEKDNPMVTAGFGTCLTGRW